MDGISQYILSVTCAAMLCAVVLRLLEGKSGVTQIAKILTGICMIVTVIAPITQVSMSDVLHIMPDVSLDAKSAVAKGNDAAKNALKERISQQVEAYILDKAKELGASLTVQVELSDDPIPVPVGVCLRGFISPYAKTRLQSILKNDLGIEKEKQIWT